ncbi:hypothetical protein ACFL49_00690 [Candidatus Omnitrophota bacterium]
MEKAKVTFLKGISISLGIFNIFWFLVLSFMTFASQFQIATLFLLGIGYLVLAIDLFSQKFQIRKLFFRGIIPLSILAVLNLMIMGTSAVASYFHMSLIEQIQFASIFVGIPIVLNALYLTIRLQKGFCK